MYYELSKSEIKDFIQSYFTIWGSDIYKVTVLEYIGYKEYLINDNYLYIKEL